jgi:hypothetical protein
MTTNNDATVQRPAGSVSIASSRDLMEEKRDPVFYVSLNDFKRLRQRVTEIRVPSQGVRNFAWFCAALVVTGGVGYMQWQPAHKALLPAAQMEFAWISPALGLLAIFAVVGVLVCVWVDKKLGTESYIDKRHVIEDMDATMERWEDRIGKEADLS